MNRTALVGNNFSLVHGPIIRFEENKHYNKISSSNTPKRAMIAASQGITYERQVALDGLSADEVLHLLNYKSLYQILDKNVPTSTSSIISRLNDYHLCEQEGKKWNITNMGAILFANNLGDFPNMKGREVIVRKYVGTNNRQQSFEQHGAYGYAVGFEGLVDFIMRNTSKEVIDVKREEISVYPRVAIREFVANAHADYFSPMHPTIRVFTDRIELQNPGRFMFPLSELRTQIHSIPRNPNLIKFFRYAKLGENAGYGIDKMLVWEKLTKGKVEFTSDLVCSTITYWFGEQVKEQVGEQAGGHVSDQAGDQPSDQAGDQPSDQVLKVLNCIRDNVYTMNVLQKKLNISSRRYVRINMLNPAIEGGYVLRAYPDKPNHPNQRYYLSEKGLKQVK